MILEYLSNIELYFSSTVSKDGKSFQLVDEEYNHAIKVMRHKIGDTTFAADGNGKIYEGVISVLGNKTITADIVKSYEYKNQLNKMTFCIPNLKNPERFKFALEKCVEMGITKFVLFNSERSISKTFNIDRINKILLSAMKQSLQAYLPKVEIFDRLEKFSDIIVEKVLFEQNSSNKLSDQKFNFNKEYYFIFGPEGGFSENEIEKINPSLVLNLAENRLRSETAIIKAASLISSN